MVLIFGNGCGKGFRVCGLGYRMARYSYVSSGEAAIFWTECPVSLMIFIDSGDGGGKS